jgi:hypothetical protein
MAIILKENKTYIDKYGNEHANAYGVIDYVICDKKYNKHHIILKIFKDIDSRNSNLTPLDTIKYCCNNKEDFDTFFNCNVLSNNTNQYAKSYEYLLQLKQVHDEMFEEVVNDTLIYEDWESDEL